MKSYATFSKGGQERTPEQKAYHHLYEGALRELAVLFETSTSFGKILGNDPDSFTEYDCNPPSR